LVTKENGVYTHTALGSLVFQVQDILSNIILSDKWLEIVAELRRRNMSRSNDIFSSAILEATREVESKIESSLGLANLRPVALFMTIDEYHDFVAKSILEAKSEIYLTSRNTDETTVESLMAAARRGVSVNMVYDEWVAKENPATDAVYDVAARLREKILSTELEEFTKFKNASLVQVKKRVPFSFLVADGKQIAIETANPPDCQPSFVVGMSLENQEVAKRLVSIYENMNHAQ
jgi:phosphatidylserine/phosphatidylglycerophosphate/cardiolipin synthase-like enzyme